MELDIENIGNEIDDVTLKELLESKNTIDIYLPLNSVGFTNSYLNIIYDHILVSYCSEKIATFVNVEEGKYIKKDPYHTGFCIRCRVQDVENLFKCLKYFAPFFNSDLDDIPGEDSAFFMEELDRHELSLHKQTFTFPELVNDYWANLINGAYWEIASEYHDSDKKFFNKIYRRHPEQKFGFWKSAQSKIYQEILYFSTENWIVPPNVDIIEALKVYSGLDTDLIIEKAEILSFKHLYVILNSSSAVWFNGVDSLKNSMMCVYKTLLPKYQKNSLDISLENQPYQQITFFPEYKSSRRRSRKAREQKVPKFNAEEFTYYLSEFGDLIIVEHMGFRHVFFSKNILSFEELKELHEKINPVFSRIQNLIGQSCTGKCNWKILNDDLFEELCYDIIYLHPKFDSSTIQKMGKSTSRDGGRDIVVKTHATPIAGAQLYIFQCKFSKGFGSLAASKLQNAGNVIMQYGAKGYGVFTPLIIDSTLYDMLDGFERNLGIDTSVRWSKYELERFLNRHGQLKKKYFDREN